MKKIIMGIVAAVLFAAGALSIWKGIKIVRTGANSVSIIGGADGPTSVFLAGKVGTGSGIIPIAAGVVIVVAAVITAFICKKN